MSLWDRSRSVFTLTRAGAKQKGLQTCETNIGSSAMQRPNWISFPCWCGWCVCGLWKCLFPKCMEWSVPMWCASLDLRKACDCVACNALFWCFEGARGSICIFETYTFTVSWSSWVGTRATISNQRKCETRRRSEPIVIQSWLGTCDKKVEVSCSTLLTCLCW